MKIKSIVTANGSKFDKVGNTYWFMSYCDTETGKKIFGLISGNESNIAGAMQKRFDYNNVYEYVIVENYPIRKFNQIVKNMKYAGCTATDINSFIDKELQTA